MTRGIFVGLALVLASCTNLPGGAHTGQEKLYWQAPVILPGVTSDQRRPGFWTARLPHPDDVVMTPEEVRTFDAKLENTALVKPIPFDDPGSQALPVNQKLGKEFDWLKRQTFYLPDGSLADRVWWDAALPKLNLDTPVPATPRFALTTAFADQRVLPDETRLTVDPLDADFDEFQNSGWDIGTPLSVLKTSADGQWVWTRGASSDGWVPVGKLAVCDRAAVEAWSSKDFVVVTDAKADLYGDKDRLTWKAWVRMGCRLPLEADEGPVWRVTLPVAQTDGTLGYASAWVDKTAVSHGYLSYTARNVIVQAFKFLDKPYGWGDQYGEQDCSRFIYQVFAVFGVELPRNSWDQGHAGNSRTDFGRQDPAATKLAAVEARLPGVTILRLDGHIMLYLGTYGGKPYVIHSFWGYSQMDGGTEVFRVANKTAVSTLDLGAGSRRGSFLDRILNIAEIRN